MLHERKVKTQCKRRSKICTYHMNETKTKTYRYLLNKDGMPSGASPILDAWVSLDIYMWCLGNPQDWALASPPCPHIDTSSSLITSSTQNSTESLVRSASIIKQITTLSTVANQFIFCFCIVAIVLWIFHGLYHQ